MLLALFPFFLAFIVGFALTNAWRNAFFACIVASLVAPVYFGIFILFTGGGFGGVGLLILIMSIIPGVLAAMLGALFASITKPKVPNGDTNAVTADQIESPR